MIKITAFRAIDNFEDCQKYIIGHKRVLEIFGITQITSADTGWLSNPFVYIILVESTDSKKVLGGARIHVVKQEYSVSIEALPIETAVSELDLSIHQLVKDHSIKGTGELCGLWNSREVAGMGIGSIFLGRVGVALVEQLQLNSLFALCAPATVQNCLRIGFSVAKNIGNNGTFYYPKDDLVATAVILNDPLTLSLADSNERNSIFNLRANPQQKKLEIIRKGELEIEYDIQINYNKNKAFNITSSKNSK